MGMACRFPAEDLPAFWRLLEAGGNAVTEVHPGSGVGRAGELFPDPEAQNKACLLAGGVHLILSARLSGLRGHAGIDWDRRLVA